MQHEKEQVALSSIAASAALTIAKGLVGLATGSLAILSEAGHSLIDLGATIMTYVAVRISGKPADEEHHYGHGKVEAVTALAETALLFLLSGIVIWEASKRLIEHEAHIVEATVWAFAVMIASMVVDFFRARALSRTAKETHSHALEADALHFSSDLWSSLAVLVGLAGVYFGLPWADSAAALVVAVLVCVAGWRLGRRTIDMLIDVAPAGAADQITAVAAKVPGVVAVEQVRARAVGETTFIDLIVAVSRTLPLDRVTAIKAAVTQAICAQMPGAEPIVTVDPVALRQRERTRPRHGDRAQPRARRPSRHGARPQRPAGDLARPGSGRQALAARRARPRGRSGKRHRRRTRRRRRDRYPHRAVAAAAAPAAARRRPSA